MRGHRRKIDRVMTNRQSFCQPQLLEPLQALDLQPHPHHTLHHRRSLGEAERSPHPVRFAGELFLLQSSPVEGRHHGLHKTVPSDVSV